MKLFKLLLFLSVLFSCQSKEVNNKMLCETISKIGKDDQLYRKNKLMEDSFFKVFDSIIEKEGISKKEYIKFSKEKQLSYGKKIRKIVNLLKDKNQKKQDSLMSLQIDLDNQNTEKLIKIIEEYGFPDKEKLNCKEYIAPFLVFVHSQEKYWKKIEKVINIEKNKGRISQGDYDYIMWHLNGRKGSPINLKK